MAQSNNENRGIELELESFKSVNDGAAVRAQFALLAKNDFATSQIIIKIFCLVERGPDIVSSHELYDSKIADMPDSGIDIELVTGKVEDSGAPMASIPCTLTLHFVFYEQGKEIFRYHAKFKDGSTNTTAEV